MCLKRDEKGRTDSSSPDSERSTFTLILLAAALNTLNVRINETNVMSERLLYWLEERYRGLTDPRTETPRLDLFQYLKGFSFGWL